MFWKYLFYRRPPGNCIFILLFYFLVLCFLKKFQLLFNAFDVSFGFSVFTSWRLFISRLKRNTHILFMFLSILWVLYCSKNRFAFVRKILITSVSSVENQRILTLSLFSASEILETQEMGRNLLHLNLAFIASRTCSAILRIMFKTDVW